MWAAVLAGFGLGLSLAAPPGPMNTLIARESSRHGALAGIKMGIAAPVADVIYLAVLLLGVSQLVSGEGWIRGAAAVGCGLMFFFAYDTWFGRPAADETAPRTSFAQAFAASMTNPYQIAWWLSGGFVFLQAQGAPGISGLLVGIFAWVVVFSWLVAHGARRWSWFAPTIRVASSLLLWTFSLLLLGVALQVVEV